jgi:hypothetical protein
LIGQRAIAGTRNDLVTAHQHTPDRHLTALGGAARLIECDIHKGRHWNSPLSPTGQSNPAISRPL